MKNHSYDEILHYLKLESIYYSRSVLGGIDWGIDVPAYEGTSMFHVVVSGSCVVAINNQSLTMNAGDVVFIPRACGHSVKAQPAAYAVDLYSLPVHKVSDFYETLNLNPEQPEKTVVLCGVVQISHPSGEMLIREMPDVVHVQRKQHMFKSVMEDIVNLVFHEARGEFLGGEEVITRLVDILMIQTIRHWVDMADTDKGCWLHALKDVKIGKALALIHGTTEKSWTIESLGREVGMSRTAFANRFTELVGESPMSYLKNWRMNLAVQRVKSGDKLDLDFIDSLGYKSEAAFRRAFKKTTGSTISEMRRQG